MHATEETTTTAEEAPRCRWGRSTPEPCPRPATVARWGEDEPNMCAEHAAASRLTDEEFDWIDAEGQLEKWLTKARRDHRGVLVELLEETLERAKRGKEDNYTRMDGAFAVANSYKG